MKKILALALTLMMVISLTACGGKTDPAPSGSTTDPGTQQTEQPSNTPDPGTQQTEQPSDTPDSGDGNEENEYTIEDCNACLDEMGITGFRFPEDLTEIDYSLWMGGSANVIYCPVENDRYDAILQSLFSDTGMTVTDPFGEAITTLDEAVSPASSNDSLQHSFVLTENDKTFAVTVIYYPNEYDDWGTIYDAQTLNISIHETY